MAESIIYNLYMFLWVIVLLPKEAQFAAFAVIVIIWSVKNRQLIRVNKATVWFLAYAAIHLISIIVAVITRDYALTRIAAAFNTCGIWVLAIWIAGIIRQAEDIDINRIGKYCVVNIGILFALYIVTLAFPSLRITNGLEIRQARVWDLLSSGETTRFCGLFEYPSLVGFFTLLQFPWAFRYLNKSKYKWTCFALIPAVFIPVFMTYSRMSILLNLVFIFVAVNYFMLDNGIKLKTLLAVYGALAFLVIIAAVIRIDDVMALASAVFNARPGSNSDRMKIYTETVNRISETSWIIGAGIKEMNSAGVYPLGSHCTYLGILYKSGIIGSICFVIGLVMTVKVSLSKSFKNKSLFNLLFMGMLALLFVFCLIEDIDGSDWLLVMTFMGCMVYNKSKI